MIDEQKWYSVKEVAGITGFSRDSIKRQIDKGFLVAFALPRLVGRKRIYRSYRVSGSDLIAWMQSGFKKASYNVSGRFEKSRPFFSGVR